MEAKDKALHLVQEFLSLNEKRREKELSGQEVERWYKLKQEIEMLLFSHPPVETDKRRSVRLQNLKIPVHYESALERCEGMIRELSEGGLFITTPDPLPVGTQLEIFIEMPGDSVEVEIQVPARVIYTNVGHSLGDRAFSGMGMTLSEKINLETRRKWLQVFDHLLTHAAGKI